MKANVSPSKANNAADWAEKKLSGGEERKRTTFAANKSHNQRSPLSPADWAYSIQNGLTLDEPPELKLGMVKVSAVLVTPPRRFSGLPAKNPPRPVVVEVCDLPPPPAPPVVPVAAESLMSPPTTAPNATNAEVLPA